MLAATLALYAVRCTGGNASCRYYLAQVLMLTYFIESKILELRATWNLRGTARFLTN
jgi:hypothetical protein